jgi:uncharacterized iron-regulated membrane protein
MALLTVAGATGGVLAYRDDIDRRLNPDIHLVKPGGTFTPLQDIVHGIEARLTDARVSTVTLPSRADGSLIAYLAAKPPTIGGTREAPEFSEVFVDPYTGRILGQRRAGGVRLERQYAMPLVVRLHYALLLGSAGVWIMGVVSIIWLATSLIGLALAWPAAWRRAAGWSGTVRVRGRQGPLKLGYDLHRSIGVVLLPVWIVLAFTSVYLSLPNLVRSLTALISPISAVAIPPPESESDGEPRVTPDAAVARALAAVPGARAFGFTRDFVNHRYSVRLVLPDEVNPAGNSQAYIDFATGEVIGVRLASDAPAGLRFLYWQFPLHSGEAFGGAGQALITIAALALVAMTATGFYMWLRGWRARRS